MSIYPDNRGRATADGRRKLNPRHYARRYCRVRSARLPIAHDLLPFPAHRQDSMLTAGEALVAAKAVRASGRKTFQPSRIPTPAVARYSAMTTVASFTPAGPSVAAPTSVTWLAARLPRRILQDLIHRLEAIAESLGDTDPRPLELAITSALETARTGAKPDGHVSAGDIRRASPLGSLLSYRARIWSQY